MDFSMEDSVNQKISESLAAIRLSDEEQRARNHGINPDMPSRKTDGFDPRSRTSEPGHGPENEKLKQ